MKRRIIAVVSWVIVLWAARVFLLSLPYKFSGHPDTRHIFGTIGDWLSMVVSEGIGNLFSSYGAYIVGSFELLTAIVLLLPGLLWLLGLMGLANSQGARPWFHAYGGLMASVVMAGAVFFHLFTPLGIEVLHHGKSDGGSLFYSALSILLLGAVLFFINIRSVR